jgi:3-dehydroquinate dehydratase type I
MVELCLTLAVEILAELQKKIFVYDGSVPIVEIRLDFLEPVEFPVLPSGSGTRYMATCRPVREGGRFKGPEKDRLQILRKAAEKGFSLVDIESDVAELPLSPEMLKIVRSRHDFHHCPADLEQLYLGLKPGMGELAKLVLTPVDSRELVRLLEFMEKSLPGAGGLIFGMGQMAQVTRFVGAFLGNVWTYVSEDSNAVAPGQFSLDVARDLYRLPAFKNIPDFYGVAGKAGDGNIDVFVEYMNNRLRDMGQNAIVLPFSDLDMSQFLPYALSSKLSYRGFIELESGSGRVPGRARRIKLSDGEWFSEPFSYADPEPASREIISFWMA